MTATVVYGPPASGKTTYVAEHRRSTDLVIDLDALCVALGSPATHDHDRHVKRVAGTARAAAIRKALELDLDVWIIDTWLRTPSVLEYPCRYVLVDPGQSVTLQRAHRDGRPDDSLDAIRRWYLNPPRPPRASIDATATAAPTAAAAELGDALADWW